MDGGPLMLTFQLSVLPPPPIPLSLSHSRCSASYLCLPLTHLHSLHFCLYVLVPHCHCIRGPHPCSLETAEGLGLPAAVAESLRRYLREEHLTVFSGATQVRLELQGEGRLRGPWHSSDHLLPAGQRKQVQRCPCYRWRRCMCWPSSWTRGTWNKPCSCSSSSSSSAGESLWSSPGGAAWDWARGGAGILLRPLFIHSPGTWRMWRQAGARCWCLGCWHC